VEEEPPVSEVRSKKTSRPIRKTSRDEPNSRAALIESITRKVMSTMEEKPTTQSRLPGMELPVEDVELVSEKINYKIALNP
jgi:hypothetical protein